MTTPNLKLTDATCFDVAVEYVPTPGRLFYYQSFADLDEATKCVRDLMIFSHIKSCAIHRHRVEEPSRPTNDSRA